MKKATLLPPPLSLEGGGIKIRAASEREPVVILVCMRVCVHVPTCVLYEADTSITYSSVLSAGLPRCVFQHASQSLCHMHYLTLTLTLMQIGAEIFILDTLTYCPERCSHRLCSNPWSTRAFILHTQRLSGITNQVKF